MKKHRNNMAITKKRISELMLLVQKEVEGEKDIGIQQLLQKTMFIGNGSEEKKITDALCCVYFTYYINKDICEIINKVAKEYKI